MNVPFCGAINHHRLCTLPRVPEIKVDCLEAGSKHKCEWSRRLLVSYPEPPTFHPLIQMTDLNCSSGETFRSLPNELSQENQWELSVLF
jgi:hypothetical protein